MNNLKTKNDKNLTWDKVNGATWYSEGIKYAFKIKQGVRATFDNQEKAYTTKVDYRVYLVGHKADVYVDKFSSLQKAKKCIESINKGEVA